MPYGRFMVSLGEIFRLTTRADEKRHLCTQRNPRVHVLFAERANQEAARRQEQHEMIVTQCKGGAGAE
jgi:hypothetical protein